MLSEGELMVESIKGISCGNARYGIATVAPNRAIRKCRIRKLRIEYYLSKSAVVLVIPKSCGVCRNDDCIDDFILQIMEKTSKIDNDNDGEERFFMPSFP